MKEEIKLILESIYSGNNHTGDVYNREAMRELLALFITKMEEILGKEDSAVEGNENYHKDWHARFILRKEQAERLSKLLEGENT